MATSVNYSPTGAHRFYPYYRSGISVFIQLETFDEEVIRLHSSHTHILTYVTYSAPRSEWLWTTLKRLASPISYPFYVKTSLQMSCKNEIYLFGTENGPYLYYGSCGEYKDIRHLIFSCKKYDKEREVLRDFCKKSFKHSQCAMSWVIILGQIGLEN